MTLLALLALVASVLVWAAPGSQAQGNQAPYADAGPDQTVNPGAAVTLTGAGSVDVDARTTDDCGGCTYRWEIETGPYDYIRIGESDSASTDDTETAAGWFEVPSEAFVDKIADSDPQKYEIVVRLTVTDDDGVTDSDTVSININQRPVADIQVYAGLRDMDIVDGDLGARGHFPDNAVIDGPGENGNRDNEWDIMEGAYLLLDGSGSTDENPRTGRPSSYQWTRVRPATLDGYAESQTDASATGQRLPVAVALSDDSNVEVINFGDLDRDGIANEVGDPTANPPQIAETISVAKLPNVDPNAPQTVFYQLTVCDSSPAVTTAITTAANCTDGRTGAALIRIVVHDASSAPKVSVAADLTSASTARGDAAPQSTVGQFTGVDNQFIVDAGSTVVLTATVEDADQGSGHNFRWSGATPGAAGTATVRVPSDADDGDTVDVSVTVTDATRISVTTDIQLLVGENTMPTAGGVEANQGSIPIPRSTPLWVHRINDGFQNRRDGSTVTLRGVGNDADGDSIITAWALREGSDHVAIGHASLHSAITTWLAAIDAIASDADAATRASAVAAANAAALPGIGGALPGLQEPDRPLFELNGALTDTVSFDVPELKNGETKGTVLIFTVIDSNGASASQLVYVYIVGNDDAPNADAGADQQVDPGSFVRLNGSASSDPDVGDEISHKWEYVGATMDPAPDERSPLSAAEVTELDGWILNRADDGTFTYIVNSAGMLTGSSDELKSTTSAYPYFDAPDLTGFNNVKLTFRLHVKDSGGTDLDDNDATTTTSVRSLSEVVFGDLNGDGDSTDASVAMVNEADIGLDLNNDGDAQDMVNLGDTAADEANVAAVDSDMVTITVVNRYFSGNIPGPDFCTGMSLGGPSTYPLDSDGDGVADICSLNTTRRATVARQNALETLANLNPAEFRSEVLGVCNAAGFKATDYGDDPSDLDSDVCETERVAPPPSAADPATADVFFSGAIEGADFCTNHSLGGARTYANDSDGDGVADICSLATTRREAVARQRALETFIVSFSDQEALDFVTRLLELYELGDTVRTARNLAAEYTELLGLYSQALRDLGIFDSDDADLTDLGNANVEALTVEKEGYEDVKSRATRYSNALAAECRALGTQDFGDTASALARDACVPTPTTGTPLG